MEHLIRRFPGLGDFPRRDLGVRSTPVEEHRVGGLALLVKREDLTHPLYGGNKPRVLEFLLALPARRLLTYSTLPARHAYATAVHGARLGLVTDAILVRRGAAGRETERLRTLGGRVVEIGGAWGAAGATLRLWRPGTRVIPPGGVSARGALGSLAALFELSEVPRRIYAPLGSGATVSGLLAGLMLRGARCEVVAVRAADRIAAFPMLLWARAHRALALLRRHDPAVPRAGAGGVTLRVVHPTGAYGEPTVAVAAALEAADGLPLEAAYTGRTLAVLLAERAEGALFWQTAAASPP